MKRLIILVLVFAFSFSQICYAEADISFEPENFSVNLSEDFEIDFDEFLTLSVWKGTDSISGSDGAHYAYFYMTENGKLDCEILLPYTLPSGRNSIYIDGEDIEEKYEILMLNPRDPRTDSAADSAAEITNSADMYEFLVDEGNGIILGIDIEDEDVTSNLPGVCNILVSQIPLLSADDPISFFKAYNTSLGIYLIKSGSDAGSVFKNYGRYMDIDYSEFASLESAIQKKTQELFKNSDFSVNTASKVYTDAVLLSGITLADNLDSFISLIEKNTGLIGIDMSSGSDYSKINSGRQYNVFVKMFENRNKYVSLDDISDSFDDSVEKVLNEKNSSHTSSSNSGGSSGNRVTTSGVVTPTTETEIIKPEGNGAKKFGDISGHYSEECIISLANKNIISGYEDNTFRPDSFVTRAEFSKIIALAMELNSDGESKEFADVSTNDWFCESVGVMSALGIINGYDGNFYPHNYLTRQDAAVIAVRILDYFEIKDNSGTAIEYNDAVQISEYAQDAVKRAAVSGIMSGNDSLFRPYDAIKRGEAVIVISRLMNALNR